MAPKTKTESKPLTQDQIAVITKRIIAEYNKELISKNEAILSSQAVTKAMLADEKMIQEVNKRMYKLNKAMFDAETVYKEEYKKANIVINNSTSSGYRSISEPDEDEEYFTRYDYESSEATRRFIIATQVLKIKLAQPIQQQQGNNSYKTISIPGIGCVYEEIIFATLDSKTDALKLVEEMLKKVVYN